MKLYNTDNLKATQSENNAFGHYKLEQRQEIQIDGLEDQIEKLQLGQRKKRQEKERKGERWWLIIYAMLFK